MSTFILSAEEIEAECKLMNEVYDHIKVNPKGCGDMSCELCGTYADMLRDAEGR